MLNIKEMKRILQLGSIDLSVIECFIYSWSGTVTSCTYSYISIRNVPNVTRGIKFSALLSINFNVNSDMWHSSVVI